LIYVILTHAQGSRVILYIAKGNASVCMSAREHFVLWYM